MFRNNRLNKTIISFVSFFLLNGCSYSTKITKGSYSTKIIEAKQDNLILSKQEDIEMPLESYNRDKRDKMTNENDLIIQGIWYEMKGYYRKSNYFYNILYEKTGKVEYLFRELTTALYAGIDSQNVSRLEEFVKRNPSNIQLKRLLVSFYINKKDNEKAKEIGQELISQSGTAIDYELSASPYILSGDYSDAVVLLTEAYNKTYNEDILMKIAVLLANYMNDIDEATRRLEEHRKIHHCSEKICNQLLEIYTKLQRVEPLIDIYHELYKKTRKEIYAVKLVEGYIYQKRFDIAISFLTNDYNNNELLYELYLAKKDYGSALIVAERLYTIEKKPKWLAESAMALYESAKDKNDRNVLNRVVNKFEKALKEGVNDSVYLNYYGYTLIDKDINVKKGIDIVKDALKEQPNNTYYLDSLAWGYYKLHKCEEAYVEMKRVVDIEGLDEDDIIQHWSAIEQCK